MWAYLTNGLEAEQITSLEAAYDGVAPERERAGRNVGALLAGMKGG